MVGYMLRNTVTAHGTVSRGVCHVQDGCLTVSAAKGLDKDEEDKKGRYIRQERYAGSLSRSFYVGEDVEPQDVKAKYENGVLKLFVPKAEVKQVPAQTAIAIE